MSKDQKDLLDKSIAFLQKREGIDKTLKLVRYTSRLIAAVSAKDTATYERFSALEKSVGVSRKAYRLGKFLQDINNLRKSKATGFPALLELVAYGGEGVYYFIEQFAWLMKAGALTKAHEKQLALMSAWAELAGYLANITLSVIKIQALMKEEAMLLEKLAKQQKEEGPVSAAAASLGRELAALRVAKLLKVASVVQDLADSTLALNDVRGGTDPLLSHPVTLAVAGLISGSISFHKNWTSI